MGPSTDICDNTSSAYMTSTQVELAAFTYHSYPGKDAFGVPRMVVLIARLQTGTIPPAEWIFCPLTGCATTSCCKMLTPTATSA
jgi:hypothetical protein